CVRFRVRSSRFGVGQSVFSTRLAPPPNREGSTLNRTENGNTEPNPEGEHEPRSENREPRTTRMQIMLSRTRRIVVWAVVVFSASAAQAQVPSPETFFGFRMGADGEIATWTQIRDYFERVASASNREQLMDIGATTEGNRMIGAIISVPENIARLDAIKAANRRLANPRTLTPEDAKAIAANQTAIIAIGASIHATEIGATQAANELLYTLATTEDPVLLQALRDVVVILFPSLNPDGHVLVVDWFKQHRGSPFESSPMPWLYHKYAGHDINRDAFMLNLTENRAL